MTSDSWLENRLARSDIPVLLDGAIGTELERNGVPMDVMAWSSMANISHPKQIEQVHLSYLEAGAEIITTNTFSGSRLLLEPAGYADQVTAVNKAGFAAAQNARKQFPERDVAIAGSLCEWVHTEAAHWHDPEVVHQCMGEQAQVLADAGVDVLILEMCQQLPYSLPSLESIIDLGTPVWIGVSARKHPGCESLGGFDYPDQDFEELVSTLARFPVEAVNVMHTPIPDVAGALEVVRRHWDGPLGVYPESGYFEMPNWQFVDVITPGDLVDWLPQWQPYDLSIIGGCCGIGPDHIAALRQTLEALEATS